VLSVNIQPQTSSNRCSVCPTRKACLASNLDDTDLGRLANLIEPFVPITKNEYLYRVGEPALRHYHVRSGMFKTHAINTSGDEYVTGFYLPGEILGCAQSVGKHTDSAVAIETSTACKLAANKIPALAEMGVGGTLFRLLGEREDLRNQQLLNLGQTRADARIAGFLIDMSNRLVRLGRCPNHIPIPMSRTDIANYLGLSLESLSRKLTRMVKAGILSTHRDYIEIIQPEAISLLGLHTAR